MFYVVYQIKTLHNSWVSYGDQGGEWEERVVWEEEGDEFYTKEEVAKYLVRLARAGLEIRGLRALKC